MHTNHNTGKEPQVAENVHAAFLIDQSGSMNPLVDDVIGGYNQFVANQRKAKVAGDCTFTAVQFDTTEPFKVINDATPISEVSDLTPADYRPNGGTPLLDALGRLIRTIEKRVDTSKVPEDQIVVVFTDGHENASTEWTREDLFRVITQKENDGWTFIFMGANQDAYDTGRRLGIKHENIQNFKNDGRGTRTAMDAVDKSLLSYRQAAPSQKRLRKSDFYGGVKDAEKDLQTRK